MTLDEMKELPDTFSNLAALVGGIRERELSWREWQYLAEKY